MSREEFKHINIYNEVMFKGLNNWNNLRVAVLHPFTYMYLYISICYLVYLFRYIYIYI